jgi:hypothetical protein
MSEDKKINADQVEQRSMAMALATAAVAGTTGGIAGVATKQVLDKLAGGDKKPKK